MKTNPASCSRALVAAAALLWLQASCSASQVCGDNGNKCVCDVPADCAEHYSETACSFPTCNEAGTCGQEHALAGTACDEDGGAVCNGSGDCVDGSGASGAGGGTGGDGGQGGCNADTLNDPENCGACEHNCLGGACVAGSCQAVLLADGFSGGDEVDVADGWVYWVRAGEIWRVPTTGSAASSLIVSGGVDSFDAYNGNVYWSHLSGLSDGNVSVKPADGGAATSLAFVAGTIDMERHLFGVVVADSKVFFTDPDGGSVLSVPVAGGSINNVATSQQLPSATAVSAERIYWINSDGNVRSFLLSGGGLDVIGGVGSGDPHTLSAVDDVVVWSSETDEGVYAKKGAFFGTLVSDMGKTTGAAVDSEGRVFVAISGVGLHVANVTGGDVTRIAENVGDANKVALDSSAVYWTTATELWRVAKPPL